MRRDYLAFNDRQKHLWWEISSSEGTQLNLNTDANDGGKNAKGTHLQSFPGKRKTTFIA